MANRVVIGRRSSSNNDRGMNVSGLQAGSTTAFSDVTQSSAIHNFDSSDVVAGSLSVFVYGQGVLASGSTTITHNWGGNVLGDFDTTKRPLVSVRWCLDKDITNGVATQVYNPNYFEGENEEETDNCEEEEDGNENCETVSIYLTEGVRIDNYADRLVINNFCFGVENDDTGVDQDTPRTIYYSYVVFHQEDFTNGQGL